MDEKDFRKAQIIISIITGIGAGLAFIITGYLGVRNIVRQQQHEQSLEFKKALLNERLAAYKDACKAVGEIINSAETANPGMPGKVDELERLYWGEMGLIEDSAVVEAGKHFRFGCKDFQQSDKQEAALNRLKKLAVDFTTACKQSSAAGWQELLTQ